MHRLTLTLAGTLALTLVAGAANAGLGAWVDGGMARVRLVAAGVGPDGRLDAGIEIDLAPGWKTYWRSPGDSGIAPVIDFSGSANIGPVEVAYPVPHRVDDGYAATNVYEGRVVLPVTAKVIDPGREVDLSLKLDIGVCEKVCIPDHFEAKLDLAAGSADSTAAEILLAARRDLPGAPEPGVFAVEKAWRTGGSERKPAFALAAAVPEKGEAQVFVEGPADWYPDVPKLESDKGDAAVYRFTFDRLGSKTPIAGATIRVTIVSQGRAIEQTLRLD